jgi:uncharacterized protein (TIGR03437 family)
LAAARVLYFKYNSFTEQSGLPFTDFAAGILRTIDNNPVDSFVIDLRGNTGGFGAQINPLTDGLQTRLPALLANPQFRIYGVVDKGTYSSALDLAEGLKTPLPPEVLQAFPNAASLVRIVGEPTGGKPGSYGEVKAFTLPSSGLSVNYSTVFHPALNVPDAPSLTPDITIPNRSADLFARHDPVLAAIIGRSDIPPPPSGDVITVSAASFRVEQGIAPGSIAAAFGQFTKTPDAVLVNGQKGTLLGAGSSSVTFIVPQTASTGPADIVVQAQAAELARGKATITTESPGIFILDNFDPSQPAAVLNQDTTINNNAAPAARGSIVMIYGTGYGAGTHPAPLVYFGDAPRDVIFSGEVAPGLWQINARAPDSLPYTGQVPVFISGEGVTSNGATIWLK